MSTKTSTSKNIEDAYPVSPTQEGILFHSLYEAGAGVYITQFTCSLTGLDVRAFEQAWEHIVERHSILRTAFVWKSVEKPLQVVGRRVKVSITQEDWRDLPAREQDERFADYLQADRERGFEFTKAPLTRLALLRVGDETYRFVWSYHHLLLDGWSTATVLKEVFTSYESLRRGQPVNLPHPRPYRDYITWLREQDISQAEKYWRETLAGFTVPTSLRVERAHGTGREEENGYNKQSRQLSTETTTRLRMLARQQQLTLNTLVQGAWALLLSRYSGQQDVLFGSVVSGRPASLSGVEEMVGLFINTLPVRVQVEDEARADEWLRGLQEQQAQMRQYEYTPLVEVQRWSEVEHGTPLFENYVVFENYPIDEALSGQVSGLSVSDVVSVERSSYPLVLAVLPGQQLTLQLFYELERYADNTMERMLGHLETLLEAIALDPSQPLARLPLLTETEQRQLMVQWNETTASYAAGSCLHELFEAQVERTPDAIAVADENTRLDYAELNRRANQLAHYLQTLGVGPETTVGLCVERSAEMIVGLLAILKAGGVYVPLDPLHPPERLQFMIEDAAINILLTQTTLTDALPRSPAPEVIYLDADWDSVAAMGTENPASAVGGDNLAYVIYTSGSTGRPKGVGISQEVAVNHLLAIGERFEISPDDHVLQFASLSFDVSLEQILCALLIGARLIVRGDNVWTASEFAGQLEKEELTVVNFPTAYWHKLAQECLATGVPDGPSKLRLTIIGGDTILPETVRLWQRTPLGGARLLNAYGPTEAAITSTTFQIPDGFYDREQSLQRIPIGRPVSHRSTCILDQHGNPLPTGVPGELHIGGPLLARGYLNQPALTAEKFIPDPYSGSPGARLYRTGDVARYLPDGNIEFLGRLDNQVKVRGFRIELGEIEAALAQHEAVREAVVLVRESEAGEKQVVAYVVSKDADAPTVGQWREYLKQWLPEYMLPTSFVTLDELPLMPSGKVDRQALRALDQSGQETASDYIAPRGQVEEELAAIWADVLEMERVGAEDDFFELGGHSLMATQVVSRLRAKFKVEIPFRSLFEEPTVRGMAGIIEQQLTAAKKQDEPAPIKRVPRDGGPLPLSFAQQRLWFLSQLEPDSPFYNIPAAVRLIGPLNVAALTDSLKEVVRRHESLRTSFGIKDGVAVQLIAPEVKMEVALHDLSHLPPSDQQPAALHLAALDAQLPFDLSHPPLLRCSLLRLDNQEHIVLLTLHHIISDGWSMSVLVKEVAALYESRVSGAESKLAELGVQYVDYAVWQREWLSGEVLEEQVKYWRERLAGAQVLELPTDRPRPPVQTYQGARHKFLLPGRLFEDIKALSQRAGTTPFMTLLAGFQTLLHRYTGQNDIVVGTPVAGRNRLETEPLIGLFVNTLVMRANIEPRSSFSNLLEQVRKRVLEAQTYQDLPFERLVEILQPERDLSRQPLFQVMFVMQNPLLQTMRLPGLKLIPMEVENTTAKFDLMLEMEETAQGLEGTFEYNTDLFDASSIERLSLHLQSLLFSISQDPLQHLSRLNLLSSEERHQLLHSFNHTHVPYPLHLPLHQLFLSQVHLSPSAPALRFQDQQLSYQQLNSRSNQLAHRLHSLGVGPDHLVGLLLERSLDMVIALLAVLKAGAAYLPLDPQYPQERLRFMIEDSGVRVLLSHQQVLQTVELTESEQVRVINLDSERERINAESEEEVNVEVDADNLAYVIYTSGSTGQPKGVCIPQRAVARLVQQANYVKLNDEEVILQFAPISFDASTFEIFGSLLNGGCLALMPDGKSSLEELGRALKQYQVTTLWLTAGIFHLMVEERLEDLRHVRQLLAGGDVLSASHVKRVLSELPGCEVINGYGPTENTTFTCCYRMSEPRQVGHRVSIGRPISNTEVYLLDAELNPVPPGVPGELYTSGDGLARGYLDQPALTAEKFIPHPYPETAGERMYRTGDVARYLPDGNIEFLGRLDNQVKVRGFRIELGEIEAALAQHEAVTEAVVLARGESAGDKRLVAYLLSDDEALLSAGELRGYLKEKLPEYMIPQGFVQVKEFPLSPNGKVDRRALHALDAAQLEPEEAYVAPRSELETVLSGIWSELLGAARVGVHDDFFELGGHSLLATQVISRVRDTLHVELPLREFFQSPTVAGMAALIENLRQSDEGAQVPPILRASREGELPLSFAQQRLWFLDQLQPDSAFYNVPVAVSLKGKLDQDALQWTLNEIIRRHEVLRTVFKATHGEPRQKILPEVKMEVALHDLSHLPPSDQQPAALHLAALDAQLPFDLSRPPLLRCSLLRLDHQEHIVLLTLHHIISDGWSMSVLVKEVAALYESRVSGAESKLAELGVQYVDYAVWQREWLSGEVLEEQVKYWRERLAGAQVLELPTDRPRPVERTFNGAFEPVFLSEKISTDLKLLSENNGVTLFMTLLAAFQALLSYYSGQEDVSIGTDIANRNHSEAERLIGFFVNQLVLRTDLSGDPSFAELLRRVREVTLDAYAHQDLPFELLVEALKLERSLKYAPLFQAKLVLQNTPQRTLALPDLTLSILAVDYVAAKFDLTLLLEETPGGINGNFEYNTDLFDSTTVNRMARLWATLIQAVVTEPDIRLSQLKEKLLALESEEKTLERAKLDEQRRKKLMGIKRKNLSVKQDSLVKKGSLRSGEPMPLVIQPASDDVDLVSWARSNRPALEADLLKHGAILCRGFNIDLMTEFEQFAQSLCTELFNENGEHPREMVTGNVYTPVFYPSDQHLLWHNENSFNYRWPLKIWFSCVQPPSHGGETPIVDSRRVYDEIDAGIKKRFMEKGVMYVRNYDAALGLDWQIVFQTTDRNVVEERCRRTLMDFEWKENNSLRTSCVRPAAIRHPATGEMSWFNQAQHWHVSCLDPATRQSMLALFSERDLPRNCYYGDGSPIEDSVMMEILDVYRSLEVSFPWAQGDILMLDNLLAAHARNQFAGERKLLVVMGDMLSYAEVAARRGISP
jgi:amino acid adenylation domain-containing protein